MRLWFPIVTDCQEEVLEFQSSQTGWKSEDLSRPLKSYCVGPIFTSYLYQPTQCANTLKLFLIAFLFHPTSPHLTSTLHPHTLSVLIILVINFQTNSNVWVTHILGTFKKQELFNSNNFFLLWNIWLTLFDIISKLSQLSHTPEV